MVRRVIGEHIALKVELSSNLDLVKADPGQIEQVVLNLVLNARDAMPRGGQIVMRTANAVLTEGLRSQRCGLPAGDYVTVAISDSGTGMDSGTLAHLFEPFFTTKKGTGVGLGLATAHGIVKQSGGDISVSSKPGRGTTFTNYPPRTAQPGEPVQTPEHVDPPKGNETVLLVEDDGGVRELIRDLLVGSGYRVLEAADGQHALKVWDRERDHVDLVLTDLVMPIMGGSRLARRLRRERPGLWVVLMSGYGDATPAARHSAHSRNCFLSKPFSPNALLRLVRRTLDEPRPRNVAQA